MSIKAVPENFGFWWEKEESDLNWYDWMFHYRLGVHAKFLEWVKAQEAKKRRFESILEVGCGRGVFYPHYFHGRRYVGLEYSKRNHEWLIEKRAWAGHNYYNGDIAEWEHPETFDLVFSSGTIDNVPDMDRFIEGMVRYAKKTIYLTAYRGWFPDLEDHHMSWEESTGAFYNDISPTRTKSVLQKLGCSNIRISNLPTGLSEIPFETEIIADTGM